MDVWIFMISIGTCDPFVRLSFRMKISVFWVYIIWWFWVQGASALGSVSPATQSGLLGTCRTRWDRELQKPSSYTHSGLVSSSQQLGWVLMAESVTVHVSEMWLFNEKWELPLEVDTMTVTLRARTFLYPTLLSGSSSTFLPDHNSLWFILPLFQSPSCLWPY